MLRVNERTMIIVVPFWMDLCASIYYLAAPLVAIELGANPIELGLVGTITAAVHMTLANFAGRLSDRFGRRALIVTGPMILTASCLIMTQVGEVKMVLALAALNGLGFAIFWPSFQAWVADEQTGSGLARNIGSFNLSWTASQLIGPTLSGFLFVFHSRLPFLVAGGLSFLLFFFMWASVRERERYPERKQAPLPAESKASNGQRSFLYAIWLANFASWFILGNVRYQFPKLARELTMAPYMIGLLMSCVGLSQFLGFYFLRESDRWHFKKSFLLGAQILAAAALLLIYRFSNKFIFASAFILIGVCVSLTYYSSLYYAVRLLAKKGKGTGLHESILGSGVVLGPLLGGIAAQTAGLRTPYLLCLAVLSAAVVLELGLIRRKGGPE
jgi:MFS family permease